MAKKDQTAAPEKAKDQTAAPEKVSEDLIPARVLRDFWPTEKQEDRVRKGQVIDVTANDLIEGMENGTLERVKD